MKSGAGVSAPRAIFDRGNKMNTYDYIASKIHEMKTQYPSLRSRPDDYVFSALCVKAHFYKNPAPVLNENDFAEIIVDSPNDGGALRAI